MTYFSRQRQLNKTLESFKQYNPDDFNVIIVDDASPEDIILPELPFEIIILKLQNKTWSNPASVFNIGFVEAFKYNPEIIVIQNAECYHQGDILGYAKMITDNSYISFGCYSLGESEDPPLDILNDRSVTFSGDSGWYNHPIHRPVAFHFCSVITSKNLIKLNGFDEQFSHGIGYEDNYFIHQIRCLGLEVEITADPIVFHQWHPNHFQQPDSGNLCEINENLYCELIKENNYRAKHILTSDL